VGGRGEAPFSNFKGTVKLLTKDIVSFESKEYNLQDLGEHGDGSEVGGCIGDDRLLELDHPTYPSSLFFRHLYFLHLETVKVLRFDHSNR